MAENKYTFHEDPGHGWLEVPIAKLKELGVVDKISYFSYQSNFKIADSETAYLEEDCDASIFMDAMKAIGEKVVCEREYREHTFIRDLASFGS